MRMPVTEFDQSVARFIARRASPTIERPARAVSWLGDEHILLAVAGVVWLNARGGSDRARRLSSHVAITSLAASDETHDALLKLYAKRFRVQIELVEVANVLDAWQIA